MSWSRSRFKAIPIQKFHKFWSQRTQTNCYLVQTLLHNRSFKFSIRDYKMNTVPVHGKYQRNLLQYQKYPILLCTVKKSYSFKALVAYLLQFMIFNFVWGITWSFRLTHWYHLLIEYLILLRMQKFDHSMIHWRENSFFFYRCIIRFPTEC